MNLSNKYYPTTIDINETEHRLNIKLRAYYALSNEYNDIVKKTLIENEKNENPWKKMKKNMKDISVANTRFIWGIGSNDEIYKCSQPCDDNKWSKIDGSLTQLSTSDTEVWGVNKNNDIFKKNVDNSNDWTQIQGGLKNISASGSNYIWGVNSNNNIYTCEKPCNGEWKNVEGSLSQLSGDSQYVWGVNSVNEIYRKNIDNSNEWEKINGKGKWISSENNKNLFLVGTDDNIYSCAKPCNDGSWKKLVEKEKNTYKKISGNIQDNSFVAIDKEDNLLKHKISNKDKTGWKTITNENNMAGLVEKGGESTRDWTFLGKGNSINECIKKAMIDTNKNHHVYSSVVYNSRDLKNSFSDTCYGGIYQGKVNKIKQDNVTTSYPPNEINILGGLKGLNILNKLKNLNEEIIQLINNYNNLSGIEIKKGSTYKKKTIKTRKEINEKLRKLKKERLSIEKELEKQNSFQGENAETYNNLVQYQYRYAAWSALAIIILTATFLQFKKN